MDWQGLLKWSIQQTDGTVDKDIKPMDPETQKWLQEALESCSVDEISRMKEIIKILASPEEGTPEDEEKKTNTLEDLDDIVSGLDRAKDFCIIGGMSTLLRFIFETKYPAAQLLALRIFTQSNQNNKEVQDFSRELGGFKLLDFKGAQIKLREQMVSAVGSMVRGENMTNKQHFLKLNGLDLIRDAIVSNPDSTRIKEKGINILKDIILYEPQIRKDFVDLPAFDVQELKDFVQKFGPTDVE